MMIVPGEKDVVPDEKHEAYHVGGHRNVDWNDDYEGRGFRSSDPSDAVHVPLMWPHWVKNGPEPSIASRSPGNRTGFIRRRTLAA